MHERSESSENVILQNEPRRHDRPQWVKRYLDLADTALGQKEEDLKQRPAA